MLTEIYGKIRALCGDAPQKSSYEVFTYTVSNIFTIAQTNISVVTVLINGIETSDYSYNSANGKITITASGLSSGDICEVNFSYSNYSDSELKEYTRAALVWISIYGYDEKDYEIEDISVYPTPSNEAEDLISLIASILIKPNYNKKSLPGGITITYPKTMSKEQVIEKLVTRFNRGLGSIGLIEL